MRNDRHHNQAASRWGREAIANLALAITLVACASFACAQGTTTRYVYDDNGRLRAVIAPSGEANIYEYDPAGNLVAIRRNTASTLEVLDFYPREGAPGTQVTIVGTGFGAGVVSVTFNGALAQVVSVNAPLLLVTVPDGATTGPIGVTTPAGTATTTRDFTIRGVSVTPASIEILSQRSVQYTAAVFMPGDQTVTWRVDGIPGGNAVVGTITDVGLYVAPKLPPTQASAIFRIRATSVSLSAVFGEVVITVRNPEYNRIVYSAGVSVVNGDPLVSPKTYSAPVSIVNGDPIVSPSVYSALVSIVNGDLAISPKAYSPLVSVTKGPAIATISPAQLTRGLSASITITGANLDGATALTFYDALTGAVVTDITASGISVNGSGASLSANLTAGANATTGRRIVVVTTPNGDSALGDTGGNIIEVIP